PAAGLEAPQIEGRRTMRDKWRLLGIAAAALIALGGSASAQDQLKHYESNDPNFWKNPPADWFLGDETQQQKGLAPQANPPLPATAAQLEENLKKIKMAPGFKISVYAANVPEARQMAWGDKGTLFVGSWFDAGNVYAITEEGGKKTVRT